MNRLERQKLFEETYVWVGQPNSSIMSLKRDDVIQRFRKDSLILFRNFNLDGAGFRSFSDQFGSDFGSYAGGSHKRERIDGQMDILGVPRGSYGGFALPAHQEMSYT